jgi:tetratricopeptide (TPR) repeat protein
MYRVSTLIIGFCCLVVPASAGAQQTKPSDVERLLARGEEFYRAGDTLGAVESFEAALEQLGARADGGARKAILTARANLGAAYAKLGRYPAAVGHYLMALQLEPGNTTVRFNLALAYYKSGRPPDAARELTTVVAAAPANRNALLVLGDCLLQMGENRKVIDLLSMYESLFGDDRAFAYVLGTALVREQQIERGQLLIDRVFKDGESAEGHVLLGTALMRQQDWPAAVKEFARAVELNPKLPGLQSLYGRALLGMAESEAATRAFQRELEINPNDFDANLYLGNLRRQEQRLDEAFAYFRRAAEMRPHDPTAAYALASTHVALGRNDEALVALEALVKQHPDFVEAHVMLATTYYRLKRKEDGDRERLVVDRLNAEKQAKERGAQETLGPAYRGETAASPAKPPQ